jgi:hypothetical protein
MMGERRTMPAPQYSTVRQAAVMRARIRLQQLLSKYAHHNPTKARQIVEDAQRAAKGRTGAHQLSVWTQAAADLRGLGDETTVSNDTVEEHEPMSRDCWWGSQIGSRKGVA